MPLDPQARKALGFLLGHLLVGCAAALALMALLLAIVGGLGLMGTM